MAINDTQCPHLDQVSVNNTKMKLKTEEKDWAQHSYTLIPARFPRIEGEYGNVSEYHPSQAKLAYLKN